MLKQFFVFTTILVLGWTSLSYSEMVVSLKQDPGVALPRIKVDIHLANGKGVAGYNVLLAYDPTVLKYVSTIQGDYLPTGGIFIGPALGQNDTYELQLSIDGMTTTGEFVDFGVGGEAQALSLQDFFFKIPDPAESGLSQSLDSGMGPSDLKYQAVSILQAAPLTSDGNSMTSDGTGTLASLAFDVLNPDMPMVIHLVGVALTDADDNDLQITLSNNVATFTRLSSDVNADGVVNILDLTSVAATFGKPVSESNREVDVNSDGIINILDLVQIANDFGQPVFSVAYMTVELPVETSVETEGSGVSIN